MNSLTKEFSTIGFQVMDMELNKKKNMIENFLYSCSHGIRSPLKTMEGLVKLMKDYPGSTMVDWRDYVTLLQHSTDRMQSILEHFQELRINTESKLVAQQIKLPVFIVGILDAFKTRMSRHDIGSQLHINQRGEFRADKWRLETILKMLISNAVMFHDVTKAKREVSLFITASESSCSIQIHDNGIGIAPAEHEKIFNLFHRGCAQSEGAGMGLFIVRQIIDKLNGTIAVQSTEGKGSIFSVWIPNQLPE